MEDTLNTSPQSTSSRFTGPKTLSLQHCKVMYKEGSAWGLECSWCYLPLPLGTQTLGCGCGYCLFSAKPRGRLSTGLPDVSSSKGIFHDSSFWAPCFEAKQGHRFLPILARQEHVLCSHAEVMSARSKEGHFHEPLGVQPPQGGFEEY